MHIIVNYSHCRIAQDMKGRLRAACSGLQRLAQRSPYSADQSRRFHLKRHKVLSARRQHPRPWVTTIWTEGLEQNRNGRIHRSNTRIPMNTIEIHSIPTSSYVHLQYSIDYCIALQIYQLYHLISFSPLESTKLFTSFTSSLDNERGPKGYKHGCNPRHHTTPKSSALGEEASAEAV